MFNNKIIPIFLLVLILQGCKDIEVIVEGNGRVYDVVGEGNINCGSGAGEGKCKNSYGNGVDSVTFKAEPDSGYRLKTWGNSCKGDVCSSTFLEGIPELLNVAFEKVPTEISYTYNASGQRVSKTVEGEITFFIYQLDGSLLAELDVNGNTVVDYIYLEGKPVAQVSPQSSGTDDTAYIHADHIGAPKAATNQSGEVIWQIKTTPFGEVYSETGALAENQRFPGQYADQESGYSYNYFRDYDPSTGRYVQSDPIGLSGGLNTYAYVGGNPVMHIDPLGLETIDLFKADSLAQIMFGRVEAPDGQTYVKGHGNELGVLNDRGGERVPLTAQELANILRNEGWQSGEPVTLVSCNTGDGSFPQQLADALGVPVTAPDGYVTARASGSFWSHHPRFPPVPWFSEFTTTYPK